MSFITTPRETTASADTAIADGLHILGRPRIDVTPRISGIFRDAFPLLVDLIDQAVQMVAALSEAPETNFIRSHVTRDLKALADEGLREDEAFPQATYRIT